MAQLSDAQMIRMTSLYEKAVSLYLDKTDFNVCEWLSDAEQTEYCTLLDIDCGGE